MSIDRLYTAQQVREIDSIAISTQFAGQGFELMQRAGQKVFDCISRQYASCNELVIFCGQGNNGGDGFVVASLAVQQNYKVTVYFLGDRNKLGTDASQAYQSCLSYLNDSKQNASNLNLLDYTQSLILPEIASNCIIVDALLGTGLTREPRGDYQQAIDYINKQRVKNAVCVIAVDIPSGLCADTGLAYSSAVAADKTVTFIALKQGLFTGDGPDHCGDLIFDALGVQAQIYEKVENSGKLITKEWVNLNLIKYLPPRLKNSHKHQYGHVVLVGGDDGMPGAITMAAQAALRAGAGLVTIVTNESHSTVLNQKQLELMVKGVTADITLENAKIIASLNKATVLGLGPGMGQTDWSRQLFDSVIKVVLSMENNKIKTILIDADGLRLLAKLDNDTKVQLINKLKQQGIAMILTPHLGEAANLLGGISTQDISKDRFQVIKDIVARYDATVVLKGVGSLVLSPGHKFSLCARGNPGMASAGMGDVLTGIIAGLAAQDVDAHRATCLAVYMHAALADMQAAQYGERGLCATDLLLDLRKMINHKI